jgi:esterase/lipase superfamily enzyme
MNGTARYGHFGRPLLVFPTEGGDAGEFERHGHDVAHDWPWRRAQLAHHLPRFC